MAELHHAGSFRDLIVYQKSRAVAREIFELSAMFPKEEAYSLTDQVRRSSRAIGAMIAEAWGKRQYPKHFVSKLSDADSEQLETQHWIEVAADCACLVPGQAAPLLNLLSEIGRMLNSMMAKSDQFCGTRTEALPKNRISDQ